MMNESRTNPKVRVGRIQYINSDPVYYDLEKRSSRDELELVHGAPACLNRRVRKGELDISPVSCVEYARHFERYLILPDLSISSFGPVRSVFLVTQMPVNELSGKRIWVTEESETSIELLKLLIENGKGVRPQYETVRINPEVLGKERPDAALVIGDLALRMGTNGGFQYHYDLADWWREETGRGFVFAVWVVRREFAEAHPDRVRRALETLLDSKHESHAALADVSRAAAARSGLDEDLIYSYLDRLVFDLSPPLIDGLRAFFDRLHTRGVLPRPVPLRFFDA